MGSGLSAIGAKIPQADIVACAFFSLHSGLTAIEEGMLSALLISMALNAATKMQIELLDAPCAVEFDLAAMSLDDLETLPSAMKAFMPPSMKYRQVSRTIIRIDRKGAECGDYVSYYLRSPSSFDGLRIKKIAPAHSN